MAMILLVGTDGALLEGLTQTLAASGYVAVAAESIAEGMAVGSRQRPIAAVVERRLAAAGGSFRIPTAAGGALILYHGATEQRGPQPPGLQRAALADLTLPLEKHRLLALIQNVDRRVRTRALDRAQTPPEHSRFH